MSDIYIVLIICLIIWGGIFFYLFYLSRELKKLKQKMEFEENFKDN